MRFADTAAGTFPSRLARMEKSFEPHTRAKQFARSSPQFFTAFQTAEAVRFELTVPCGTLVFKTSAIDLSATPPYLRQV